VVAATRPIRVLHCDDVADVRELVRFALEDDPRLEPVGGAGDADELLAQLHELRPDVVLLDLALPGRDGLELIPVLLDAAPGVRVVVFSGFAARPTEPVARELGAAAYVEKAAR
jgi:DNA-binding NarL/FixJ family response regulator